MVRAKASPTERRRLDVRLDEALAQTFPASDPISIGHATATEPPSRPVDANAPLPPKRMLGQSRRRAGGRPATT
jgi:hypothetical protein